MNATTAPVIDAEIARVAAANGWTSTPVGNIGHLYSRDAATLRVNYTTVQAKRRTVREFEWERPAPAGPTGAARPPFITYGGAAHAAKRSAVLDILAGER